MAFFDRLMKKGKPPKTPLTPAEASGKAKEILLEAKDEALRIREKALEQEKRLEEKEANLEKKQKGLEQEKIKVQAQEEQLHEKQNIVKQKHQEIITELEQVSQLSRTQAQKKLMEKLDRQLADEAVKRIHEAEEAMRDEAERKSTEILISTMQRISTEHVAVSTSSEVKLPDEDMKGRIIGKEGRNIKAFENAAGVQVEIGEEPNIVVVSAFDPVRREVARRALEKLIADGRIQPSRIEEIVQKTSEEVDQIIFQAGEKHAYEAGVTGLPREIIQLLGRFAFRTSYGQNMLEHNLEVVRIGIALAHEVGANVETVRKACLLHDIGKAVSAETEGTHAEVGADLCRRYGIEEEVIEAFAGHHTDHLPTWEAVIVYLADAISGARPGARREDYEAYVQRVRDIENIAENFKGVDKAYAISAGREVRVLVRPEEISDAEMVKLAHDISYQIHEQIAKFPGQIKVSVIRETRTSAIAKPKSE